MFIPVSKPLLDEKESKLVLEAVNRGDISGNFGSFISEFEKIFADFCQAKYAVTVNSGTTAIQLALAALKISKDDEVIVATLTNMATFFAVIYQGAKPIPIDCDAQTLNINPDLIEAKITPKTKAIIVVHLYGHPVDMDPILAIAKKHKLYVIEDAAEAHGATYKGKKVGSLGDVGCFSFYANKIITTGEGGMVTTNDSNLADRVRMLKSLAFGKENKFMHQEIGYSYRMTNVQAAIGVAQMDKIKKIIDSKRKIAEYYLDQFKGIKNIQLPVEKPYAFNVYWMFNIVLAGKLSGKRSDFMKKLDSKGVETREDFVPFNLQDIFIKQGLVTAQDSCPVADNVAQNGFYLPSGTDISEDELEYVARQVKEVARLL